MRRTFLPPKAPRRRADGGRPAGAGRPPAPPRARGGARADTQLHGPVPEFAAEQRVHERDLLVVCGLAAVEALFLGDAARVERLFFEPRLARALATPRRLLAKTHKPYREVEADELARIAGTIRHGGVVAVARPKPLLALDPALAAGWARDGRALLILDGIGNPHNLGAIVRSAAYFGVRRIVLADRPEQALPSAASYRVAEGALDRVFLYRAPLAAALPALKRFYRIVGTALGHGVPLAELRSDRPVALILGNEENGIDPATLALCDTVVTIPGVALPGSGQVQSLNVAAAAAVLCYALRSP
jgi:RNA methyltransferase, TrmH family